MPERTVLPIANLCLDPENPRLPTVLHHAKQEEILKFMLNDEGIIELMKSIAESGYFDSEPILVVQDDSDKTKYIVVEGNRRLTALLLLKNPNLATLRKVSVREVCENIRIPLPEEVPVILYEKRSDVLSCLGYRHITGIKSWGALEKARYLYQLYQIELQSLDDPNQEQSGIFRSLAQKIGSRADYVKKLLLGYSLYEKARENDYFNMPNELSEERINFSLLTTAIGLPDIKNFMGIENSPGSPDFGIREENLNQTKEVFEWIFKENANGGTKLKDSRNLPTLAKVIANKEALEIFRSSGDLEMASLYTGILDEKFEAIINQSAKSLDEAKKMIELLTSPNKAILTTLDRISRLTKTISTSIEEIYFSRDNGNND